jgi:excisionase family DNA binding protein
VRLLDVPGAARYLGVGERFVRRLVAERRVRFYRVGRHIRFRPGDLEQFLSAGRSEASSHAALNRVELAGRPPHREVRIP